MFLNEWPVWGPSGIALTGLTVSTVLARGRPGDPTLKPSRLAVAEQDIP
jgi:hypothetical protein